MHDAQNSESARQSDDNHAGCRCGYHEMERRGLKPILENGILLKFEPKKAKPKSVISRVCATGWGFLSLKSK